MVGGPRPARVEEAGPDPPHLGPASLPGQVGLAEEDEEAGVGQPGHTVGGGEEGGGGEESPATEEHHLLSPGLEGAQGGSPGLAG